jgi:very-short-patch-repair endonuclease
MMTPDDLPSRQDPVDFARRLRRELTVPERHLWYALRDRRFQRRKFRRQVPIGPFVVDFFCHSSGLVIELDGRSHDDRGEADRARQDWLAERGYRVLRVSNDDVIGDLEGVCLAIVNVRNPHPPFGHPLPGGEGGEER